MFSVENETIKFSILVPVYQVEKYIDECIQSVLDQTYSNWELILVDDGSRDKSGAICDRYAEKDGRIRVYHKENGGLIHTRRYGIAHATGDYCIFLDSDDWIKKDSLEVIYNIIRKYSCDCVIYGFERIMNSQVFEKSTNERECCITDKRELYKKCFMGNYNALWRKAVKTRIFKDEQRDYSAFCYLSVGEDLLQSIEIWEKSNSVVFINDKLYYYRLNPNSIMQTITYSDKYEPDFTIMQRVLDFHCTQEVFNEKDLAEYRGYGLRLVCIDVYKVCNSKTTYANKCRILNQIKATEYYKTLTSGTYDKKKLGFGGNILYTMFKMGWYRMLSCFIVPAYSFLEQKRR